jgi:SOS-response transcriptional repressor LexA
VTGPDPLTPTQLDLMRIIQELMDERFVAPTRAELAREMVICGSNVQFLLEALAAKRWIRIVPHKARGIEVLHRAPMLDFAAIERELGCDRGRRGTHP